VAYCQSFPNQLAILDVSPPIKLASHKFLLQSTNHIGFRPLKTRHRDFLTAIALRSGTVFAKINQEYTRLGRGGMQT